MFLVEVVIIVMVGSDKTTARLLPSREVLVLRRYRYRVIAFAGGRERHFRHSKKNITYIPR